MRYLHRTHRVSVSWLHERFAPEDAGPNHNLHIDYELTDRMCADIYTKIFTDPPKWLHACDLINVIDPRRFKEVSALLAEHSLPPDSGGGTPTAKILRSAVAPESAIASEEAGHGPRDHWIVQDTTVVRVHAVPRVKFYRPTTENGTPFSGSGLRSERVTTMSNGSEFHDAWRDGTDPTQVEPWTGTTTFFVAAGPPRDRSQPRVRSLPGGIVSEARNLYQSAIGQRRSHASGWLWGAHHDRGIPKVDRPGPEVTARLQRVAKALRAHLGNEMAFSTVILCDADAAEFMLKAEPYGLGIFFPFYVGQDGGGYREREAVILKSGGKELRVCAHKLFHWPAKDMAVLPKRSEGRGVAVLSLVQSSAVKLLDLYDIIALKKAGCPDQWDHPSRLAAPAANAT